MKNQVSFLLSASYRRCCRLLVVLCTAPRMRTGGTSLSSLLVSVPYWCPHLRQFFGGHSVLMDVIDLSTAVVRECSRSSGLGELATWRCWKARRRAGGGPASTSEWCTASAFGCCPCEQSGLGRKKKAFKAFVYYRVLSGRALYLKSFWNEEKYPPKIVPSLFTTDFLQSLWLVICSLNSIFDHSSQNLNFFWTQEI